MQIQLPRQHTYAEWMRYLVQSSPANSDDLEVYADAENIIFLADRG